MARLPKQGLDYFPLDVDFESDPKLRKLVRAHGSEGILVYIEFLCIVYLKIILFLQMLEN